jgi:hypothetical protein
VGSHQEGGRDGGASVKGGRHEGVNKLLLTEELLQDLRAVHKEQFDEPVVTRDGSVAYQ